MRKTIDYTAPPLRVFLRYFRPHLRLFTIDMRLKIVSTRPFVLRRRMLT